MAVVFPSGSKDLSTIFEYLFGVGADFHVIVLQEDLSFRIEESCDAIRVEGGPKAGCTIVNSQGFL
jgi:hypothetical protein